MSLAFKFVSLGVRTLAKPVGNYIKQQAREHDGFRRRCITFAQFIHRIDMRMRLGLLQDPAVIERQIQREQQEHEAKLNPTKSKTPTVKTLEETQAEEKERAMIREKLKKRRPIKPLSEAKAIDSGATFISEGFLFLVAGGLIAAEYYRGKWKEGKRRDVVAERLDRMEEEIEELRSENATLKEEVGHNRNIGNSLWRFVTFGTSETQSHPPASSSYGSKDDETKEQPAAGAKDDQR